MSGQQRQREHGHVIAVNVEKLGDTLDADAAMGATTLVVGDVADFDELGGSLTVNGEVLKYATCDDDAGTITLTDALPAAAELGDNVHVWDTQRLTVATEYIAQVIVDDDDEGDKIEAVVAFHLVKSLPRGIRGLVGESVLLEEDEDDEWRVIDVLGVEDESAVKFWQDRFDLTEAGPQDLQLTHLPLLHSEHVYWNGLYQHQVDSWTRADQTISILGSESEVGDAIVVEYAYLYGDLEGSTGEEIPPVTPTVVEFHAGSEGNITYLLTETPMPEDLIVVIMSNIDAGGIRQVLDMDGCNATWTKEYDGPDSGSEHTVWCGRGGNISDTITATLSGAGFHNFMTVFLLRGFGTSTVVAADEATTTGTGLTGPALTAGEGSFVIAVGTSLKNTGFTFPSAQTPSGWTTPANRTGSGTPGCSYGVAYRAPTSDASHHCDIASSTSVALTGVVVVIEEAP